MESPDAELEGLSLASPNVDDGESLHLGHPSRPSMSSSSITWERPLLIEFAWEIAKKVGGIYTVMKTKAPVTVAEYGDRYIVCGPGVVDAPGSSQSSGSNPEIEHLNPPSLFALVIQRLKEKYGIRATFGRWLIPGNPRTILLDLESTRSQLGNYKKELWDRYGISNPENGADADADGAIIFGFQAFRLMEEISAALSASSSSSSSTPRPVIAHYHEWQVGLAIPLIRSYHLQSIATVFTTHATLLGRYICSGGGDLYSRMGYLKPEEEAAQRGILHRHMIEKLAAQHSHAFTTVSHVTGDEATAVLGRKPDVVTPNGLQVDLSASGLHEFQIQHATYKSHLNEFIRGHFSPVDWNLDDTIYMFSAGRYEYRNKGVDLFIESLARLNHRLKDAGSTTTVVAFLIFPAPSDSFNVETLRGQALVKEAQKTVESIGAKMQARLLDSVIRGQLIDPSDLLTKEETVLLKRRIVSLKRSSLPPICTMQLKHEESDPIMAHLRRVHLINRSEDRVKVIFHPAFISPVDPIWSGMEYSEFVRANHLGVFASYYEPFGYTPAEALLSGIPSITSNLTGFASYMQQEIGSPSTMEEKGIFVVDRRHVGVEGSIEQMTDILFKFTKMSRRERIEMRNRCEALSPILSWEKTFAFYKSARSLAISKIRPAS